MINQSKLSENRVRQQASKSNFRKNFMFSRQYLFSRIILILKQSRNFRLNNKPQSEAGTQPQGFQLSESI